MSTTVAPRSLNMAEPIPGYHTQQRLGLGGYGEVWQVRAPGGIDKAIKIVYGYQDDVRAARELASLNRIKEVRHPFLLSLERIELVGGHLVIVTELASGSLKNLFDKYREAGQTGIPRAELLLHLGDAADALDYICQEHSLQHLDVKPENLLLVGGRIKVADFGLVKDLQENCSIINGLTPAYAAPELFDGRPSNHSDQYSLAIVYQQMLTGTLPHAGRTTAQLAAQHLHSPPRLDPLSIADQATIAQALAKDPAQRFANCRELIDRLRQSTSRAPSLRPLAANEPAGPLPTPQKTEVITPQAIAAGAMAAGGVTGDHRTTALPTTTAAIDLPSLDLPCEGTYRPTLVVGIGGLAAQTLLNLHRRLVDRFGAPSGLPALQMLLLDTDAETLQAVTRDDGLTPLPNEATLHLPLRAPTEYRRDASTTLSWLSRRWIFNIPRSLQTEGLRPLGRLALVDHWPRVAARLQQLLRSAVDPAGLAATTACSGLPFAAGPPRVFVVASTSGGAGSGMALDVGYGLRAALRELGLGDEGLCGLLAHCTGRPMPGRDIAVANSYACLRELQHYNDPRQAGPHGPDGTAAEVPVPAGPFAQTYVLNLGEDLDDAAFTVAAQTLAKYLYCNAVTPAAGFFDQCRRLPPEASSPGDEVPRVRSFGLCELGFSSNEVPPAAVDELCEDLLTRWRCAEGPAEEASPVSLHNPAPLLLQQLSAGLPAAQLRAEATRYAEAIGLTAARVTTQLQVLADREMGDDYHSYLINVLEQLMSRIQAVAGDTRRLPPAALILETLDQLIVGTADRSVPHVCLEAALERHIQQMAAVQGQALREWILGLVARPEHRLQGAQRAASLVTEYVRGFSQEVSKAVQTARQDLATRRSRLLADEQRGRRCLRYGGWAWRRRLVADRRLDEYFRLRIEETTSNGVCRLAGMLLGQVAKLDDKLRNLAAEFNRLAEQYHRQTTRGTPAANVGLDRAQPAGREVAETLVVHRGELLTRLERALDSELHRFATSDAGDLQRGFAGVLRRTARAMIHAELKQNTLQKIAAADADQADMPCCSLAAGLQAAAPRLRAGGGQRLLLLAPASLTPATLVTRLRQQTVSVPTVITSSADELFLSYEVEGLSVANAAAAILARRGEFVEVAGRLLTRSDVPWAPL